MVSEFHVQGDYLKSVGTGSVRRGNYFSKRLSMRRMPCQLLQCIHHYLIFQVTVQLRNLAWIQGSPLVLSIFRNLTQLPWPSYNIYTHWLSSHLSNILLVYWVNY